MNVSGMDGWKPRWMNRRTYGRTNDAVDDCYVLYIRLAFKGDRHIKQQSQLYHRYAEGRTDWRSDGQTDWLAGESRKLSTLKCSVTRRRSRRRSRHRCRISKNRTFFNCLRDLLTYRWEIWSPNPRFVGWGTKSFFFVLICFSSRVHPSIYRTICSSSVYSHFPQPQEGARLTRLQSYKLFRSCLNDQKQKSCEISLSSGNANQSDLIDHR